MRSLEVRSSIHREAQVVDSKGVRDVFECIHVQTNV